MRKQNVNHGTVQFLHVLALFFLPWQILAQALPARPVLSNPQAINDTFSFGFFPVPGCLNKVEVTSDLTPPRTWQNVAEPPINTGDYLQFQFLISAPWCFFRVQVQLTNGIISSSNVVGWVKRVMQHGTNLVANPFSGTNYSLDAVLPNCPDWTELYKPVPGGPDEWAIYYDGIWDPSSITLRPGEGAILVNDDQPFEVTFTGEIREGTLANPLPAGRSLRGSMVPVIGLMDFPAQDGDRIETWDAATQTPLTHQFSSVTGWSFPPIIYPGEAFWVTVSTATNWIQHFLVEDLLPPNHPPVMSPLAVHVQRNRLLTLARIKLLLLASDPDGDIVDLVGASGRSTNGGTVWFNSESIFYLPVTNFIGKDEFSLILSDGRGAFSTNVVDVVVSDLGSGETAPPINGCVTVTFYGVPGETYTIEYKTNLADPSWLWRTNLMAHTNSPCIGQIVITEPVTGICSRFYRAVYPSRDGAYPPP